MAPSGPTAWIRPSRTTTLWLATVRSESIGTSVAWRITTARGAAAPAPRETPAGAASEAAAVNEARTIRRAGVMAEV
jgi:hypothetical protein